MESMNAVFEPTLLQGKRYPTHNELQSWPLAFLLAFKELTKGYTNKSLLLEVALSKTDELIKSHTSSASHMAAFTRSSYTNISGRFLNPPKPYNNLDEVAQRVQEYSRSLNDYLSDRELKASDAVEQRHEAAYNKTGDLETLAMAIKHVIDCGPTAIMNLNSLLDSHSLVATDSITSARPHHQMTLQQLKAEMSSVQAATYRQKQATHEEDLRKTLATKEKIEATRRRQKRLQAAFEALPPYHFTHMTEPGEYLSEQAFTISNQWLNAGKELLPHGLSNLATNHYIAGWRYIFWSHYYDLRLGKSLDKRLGASSAILSLVKEVASKTHLFQLRQSLDT
jgi:hypothetical protein